MGLLLKLLGKPDAADARDDFAHLAIKALRSAGVQGPIEYDASGFALRIRSKAETERAVALDPYYPSDGGSGRFDREDAVARLAEATAKLGAIAPTLPLDFEEAARHLRPLIRGEAAAPWASRPFAGVLQLGVGYDLPDTVARVTEQQLEAWETTLEGALEVATANLRSSSSRRFVELRPGIFASAYADVYDSSRLLLVPEILALPLSGDPVAVVPTRACLLVAGSGDEDGVAEMVSIAERAQAEDFPVSLRLLRLSPAGWRPF